MTPDEAAAVVTDPATSPDVLMNLLEGHPHLAVRIARHPQVDDDLLHALAALDDRAVDAVLAWRPAPADGWQRVLIPAHPLVGDGTQVPAMAGAVSGETTGGDDPGQPSAHHPRRRRRLVWGAAALALLISAGAVATVLRQEPVIDAAREFAVPQVLALTGDDQADWVLSTAELDAFADVSGAIAIDVQGQGSDGLVQIVGSRIGGVAIIGVDLRTGQPRWTLPMDDVSSCAMSDTTTFCTTAKDVVAVAGVPLLTEGKIRQIDTLSGADWEPVGGAIGTVGDDIISSRQAKGPVIDVTAISRGTARWTAPIAKFSTGTTILGVLDAREGTATSASADGADDPDLVAIAVIPGPRCTPFSGDGGQCPRGTHNDLGHTVLLDAHSGAERGTLPGLLRTRFGDEWIVLSTDGLLSCQRDDATDASKCSLIDAYADRGRDGDLYPGRYPDTSPWPLGKELLLVARQDGTVAAYRPGRYTEPTWVSQAFVATAATSVRAVTGGVIVLQQTPLNGDLVAVVDATDGTRLWTAAGSVVAADSTSVFLTQGMGDGLDRVDVRTGIVEHHYDGAVGLQPWGERMVEVNSHKGITALGVQSGQG